jgi:hypothetical protein
MMTLWNPSRILAQGARGLFVVCAVAGALAFAVRSAEAHNVAGSGAYSCEGGWTYSASYLNGGGAGSSHNRLVVIDVNIGGNTIKQYHYFDTLTSHPAAPAGFTLIDHPTTATFQLFALTGLTSPITASGTIKVYSAGTAYSPSADPAYPRYLPDYSLNPVPGLTGASNCPSPTFTKTPTATPTMTLTATPTATATHTPPPADTPTATAIATNTPQTPTATSTPLSPMATSTGVPPTATTTAILPSSTPGGPTETSVPLIGQPPQEDQPQSEALGVVIEPDRIGDPAISEVEAAQSVELPATGDGNANRTLRQLSLGVLLLGAAAAGLFVVGMRLKQSPE